MRFLQTYLALAILTACQTGPPAEPAKVPVALEPNFVKCVPADGALLVKVFHGGDLNLTSEVDWVAKSDFWDIQAISPLGQTVARIRRSDRRIKASGAVERQIPDIKVLDNGFLSIDDHLVGIRADEVPCLLGHRLPRSWLLLLMEVTKTREGKIRLRFQDDVRNIVSLLDPRDEQFCTDVEWSNYWGLAPTKVTWCRKIKKKVVQGSLGTIQEISLQWTEIK